MAKNKSFTLIELIIAISIILLMSGLTIAYYNNFSEQQKLEYEVNKIIAVLELAKKRAVVSDLQNIDCQGFSGYRVNFAATSYSMKLICTPDCESSCSRTFSLSSANMSLTVDNPSITFKPLYAGTDRSAGVNITVTDLVLNKCKKINISPNGIINKVSICP